MDVVAASKRRPLAPIVGKLRSVKCASEIEVMKASAEISARAHAKVSECMAASSFRVPCFLADARERNRRCTSPSRGSPRLIFSAL